MRGRRWALGLLVVGLAAGFVWHFQSQLLGVGARWYLHRIARQEEGRPADGRRAQVVSGFHRLLLLAPPPEAMVPELFEFITQLSTRVATGEVSFAWGAYLYTAYVRDLVRERPQGIPPRPAAAVSAELDRQIAFYNIQKRPDVPGVRVSDLLGDAGESYTLEEIQQAEREGRELPLR